MTALVVLRGALWTASADVMLANGTGTFAAPLVLSVWNQAQGLSFEPREVAVGDFNKDGKQDLVFLGFFNTAIALGDGKGGFGTPSMFTGGGHEYELLVKDMNGDGNEDVISLYAGSNLSILTGDGTGKMGAPFRTASLGWALDIAAGDFNGDGRPDLAIADSTSPNIHVLMSTCK